MAFIGAAAEKARRSAAGHPCSAGSKTASMRLILNGWIL